MTFRKVVVIGATSGIARAISAHLARQGTALVLAGRDGGELDRLAADLTVRYRASAVVEPFDALAYATHATFAQRCLAGPDGADAVVLCFGALEAQEALDADAAAARRILDANLVGAVSVLTEVASAFEERGRGVIAVLSSVAGDRGRQSNYVYGAAKAGLSTYCAGLRNRLFRHGVHVTTVKPGFVSTAMTRGTLDPASPLVASPDRVARDVVRAMERRRDVVYTPWFWRWIMLVIRAVPETLFKRLRL